MKTGLFFLITLYLLALFTDFSTAAEKKEEEARLYYSEEYTRVDGIALPGKELNYEEVFKNYRYYETGYDSSGRILFLRAYKRGDIEWEEKYGYMPDGKINYIERKMPGLEPVITYFGNKGEKP